MRITHALLPVAAAVLVAPAAATARNGLAIHGWAVHPRTATAAPVVPLPLAQLPLTLAYPWTQALNVPATPILTLAKLPILTTYPWAQPGTHHQHVLHGAPWSL